MRWTTLIGQVVDVRVLGEVLKWPGSEEAWPNWSLMSRQLSENVRIGTDVVSNGQLGGVQLCFLIVLCTGKTGIVSQMLHEVGVRGRGDFSCWRVPRRTMHWQC